MDNSISIIIVCRNAVENIEKAIISAINASPDEIVIVDGNSTDGTLDIIKKYDDKVKLVSDPGKGVAMARQIGADASNSDWIFYLGCDNEIEPDSVLKLRDYLVEHDWVMGGMLTRIKDTSSYLAFCNNERWKTKITEGEKTTVGTPSMIRAEILKQYKYNTERKFSDDTELCERLREKGYKIGYSDIICYEILDNSFSELKARFKMYGISDAEVYNSHKSVWSTKRKIKSLLHPWNSEFVQAFNGVDSWSTKIRMIPYLTYITYTRYVSWYRNRNIHQS